MPSTNFQMHLGDRISAMMRVEYETGDDGIEPDVPMCEALYLMVEISTPEGRKPISATVYADIEKKDHAIQAILRAHLAHEWSTDHEFRSRFTDHVSLGAEEEVECAEN